MGLTLCQCQGQPGAHTTAPTCRATSSPFSPSLSPFCRGFPQLHPTTTGSPTRPAPTHTGASTGSSWAYTWKEAGELYFAGKEAFFFFWFVCLPFYYLNSQAVFGHCCPHRLLVGALSKITVNKPFTFSRRKPPLQSKLRKYLHLVVSMYSPVYHTTHFKTAMHNLLVQKIDISPLGTAETINCPVICLPVCTKSVNITFTLGLFCFSNSLTCLSPPWLQDGDASRPAARRLG